MTTKPDKYIDFYDDQQILWGRIARRTEALHSACLHQDWDYVILLSNTIGDAAEGLTANAEMLQNMKDELGREVGEDVG